MDKISKLELENRKLKIQVGANRILLNHHKRIFFISEPHTDIEAECNRVSTCNCNSLAARKTSGNAKELNE